MNELCVAGLIDSSPRKKRTLGPPSRTRIRLLGPRCLSLTGSPPIRRHGTKRPVAIAITIAGVLARFDVLPEVGDSVEILASGVFSGQSGWALIERKVPEGLFVGFGEANHGGCSVGRACVLINLCAWR